MTPAHSLSSRALQHALTALVAALEDDNRALHLACRQLDAVQVQDLGDACQRLIATLKLLHFHEYGLSCAGQAQGGPGP